jgi:hypothetical protein
MGVATATAIAGVAAAAISTGTSISQANKANKARIKAQKQVEAATNEAKKEIERMPMQELSLNLAAYEQSREAQQRGIQQVMSQAALDPRQAAAVGGRAMMAGIEGERGIRADQAKEMFELEKIKATERAEASDKLANLSLAEAEGAQAAAADAVARQTAATTQAVQAGVEGLGSAMNLYSSVQGPYDPTSAGMQAKNLVRSEVGAGRDTKMIQGFLSSNPDQYLGQGVDVSNLGSMSDRDFQAWLASNISADQQRALMSAFQSGASMNRPSI